MNRRNFSLRKMAFVSYLSFLAVCEFFFLSVYFIDLLKYLRIIAFSPVVFMHDSPVLFSAIIGANSIVILFLFNPTMVLDWDLFDKRKRLRFVVIIIYCVDVIVPVVMSVVIGDVAKSIIFVVAVLYVGVKKYLHEHAD